MRYRTKPILNTTVTSRSLDALTLASMDRPRTHMLLSETGLHTSFRPRLSVTFASSAAEVREAQRLRYKVFAEEMQARLPTQEPGIDSDSL